MRERELDEATTTDLYSKRAAHVRALADIDQAITSLQRVMSANGLSAHTASTEPLPRKISVLPVTGRRFSMMSVRWAILILLDEAPDLLSQPELIEALETGVKLQRFCKKEVGQTGPFECS
jgi:hypothetical protein